MDGVIFLATQYVPYTIQFSGIAVSIYRSSRANGKPIGYKLVGALKELYQHLPKNRPFLVQNSSIG